MPFEDFDFPKPLKDGKYIARIEHWERVTLRDGRRPVKWQLRLIGALEGTLLNKFHWIDKEGGRRLFLKELQRIGKSPTTGAEIERDLQALVGSLIESQSIDCGSDIEQS
ncbi:hypothetical protein [Heliorestis convoluta]|uniref:Uncharacterized protein n=1 Tax=Heliorestis convoluta TaxID=356322 RepID=A0A5Q2N5K1_9FIRM|nr:hypothetical protein [Heliorestis convoluta]QGG48906.1 hypothetical protein FTV88_2817 [Heliorestis convoluta]